MALDASFRAELVQTCVVTLEPFSAPVEGAFERVYAPGSAEEPAEEELGEEDPPDAIIDGVIDIGEAVAEQLALELDPFPRAPGVVFEGFSVGEGGDEASPANPFAVLAKLKEPKGEG